jgi:hypothetical protein
MAIPVNKIGRPSGSVPSTPLLMPVACQREVTRVASALAKVSNAWSRTSLAFAWNASIHALNASPPRNFRARAGQDKILDYQIIDCPQVR